MQAYKVGDVIRTPHSQRPLAVINTRVLNDTRWYAFNISSSELFMPKYFSERELLALNPAPPTAQPEPCRALAIYTPPCVALAVYVEPVRSITIVENKMPTFEIWANNEEATISAPNAPAAAMYFGLHVSNGCNPFGAMVATEDGEDWFGDGWWMSASPTLEHIDYVIERLGSDLDECRLIEASWE